MRKIVTFWSMPRKMKGMALEAYLYLGWARVLKKFPFAKVAPSLGTAMEETSLDMKEANVKTIKQISSAIHLMSCYTLWESQCLVKAIAAMKMLEKRQIESTLYLGTGKDENGKLIAHAWLRSGPYYVSGSEGMEKFTVIASYAKSFHPENRQGESYG
ncbi:stage V sporulation protein S [Salipaludibacillus keqinensis]|uniref:Stage V sporulation protein S n=1 Tax=Salipaludibacillus keqinensis TaxID=2045207 RepID=A0A323TLL7_9BACI|nr:lasso peptide biosynthesis B2 protein [Salipaludibacillus keqinensis]PYZ94647.1 stage V sporulation protein S [Salipaludibacillus keqinensis]